MRIAGRFTNHDDAIEDDTLAASLATTAKLWAAAYAELRLHVRLPFRWGW